MADHEAPDIFSDLFNIQENALGLMVILARTEPPLSPGAAQSSKPVAVLRFSPENWKVLLMTGRKQIKSREARQGAPIKIADDVLKTLGLTEADW